MAPTLKGPRDKIALLIQLVDPLPSRNIHAQIDCRGLQVHLILEERIHELLHLNNGVQHTLRGPEKFTVEAHRPDAIPRARRDIQRDVACFEHPRELPMQSSIGLQQQGQALKSIGSRDRLTHLLCGTLPPFQLSAQRATQLLFRLVPGTIRVIHIDHQGIESVIDDLYITHTHLPFITSPFTSHLSPENRRRYLPHGLLQARYTWFAPQGEAASGGAPPPPARPHRPQHHLEPPPHLPSRRDGSDTNNRSEERPGGREIRLPPTGHPSYPSTCKLR